MHEIAIALGSNLGNRLDYLRQARAMLAAWPGGYLTATAPVYETAPVDVPAAFRDQWFLNSMLIIESVATPEQILTVTQAIEKRLGRDHDRVPRNGPRPIDLDLIYVGDQVVATSFLRLPHPRWAQRAFVVRPLADLRPMRILPGETRPVHIVLDTLNDSMVRRYADCPWC